MLKFLKGILRFLKAEKIKNMPKSFGPSVDERSVQIVVGTMPSAASLGAGQYYAHPQNKFWPIACEVFTGKEMPADYGERLNILLKNKTGLWDSLAYCERKGSLDKDIKEERPNDFITLLKKHPKIKRLIFNGQKAHAFFIKYFGRIEGIEYIVLPSTSPANASLRYCDKLKAWKILADFQNR
jgi:hypoxanthine-DNA glycosylase